MKLTSIMHTMITIARTILYFNDFFIRNPRKSILSLIYIVGCIFIGIDVFLSVIDLVHLSAGLQFFYDRLHSGCQQRITLHGGM